MGTESTPCWLRAGFCYEILAHNQRHVNFVTTQMTQYGFDGVAVKGGADVQFHGTRSLLHMWQVPVSSSPFLRNNGYMTVGGGVVAYFAV
jgi:hypothetical protein